MEIRFTELKAARIRKGWTKAKLAEKTGLDQSTIRRHEEGENAHPGTLKTMADALGVSMNKIVITEKVGK